jgi:hypothetical protein
MLTACTEEVDEIGEAVNEILGQLDLKNRLLKNSVGLVCCDPEFIHSGVVEAVLKKLPFDTVGITTRSGATNGVVSAIMLSISVLTADDVNFSVALSGEIAPENVDDVISSAYREAEGRLPGKPVLVLAYPPMILSMGCYPVSKAIFSTAGDTPVFGTLPCSPFHDHRNSFTILNGAVYARSAVLVLLSGNIHPDFLMISTPEQNLQKQYGIITKSDGCMVYTVNEMSFTDYLANTGIAKSKEFYDLLYMIPFMVNFNDGSPPVARGLYSIKDDGPAVFGSEMPEGKAISPSSLNYDGIMGTAEELLRQISLKKNINGIIMHSCLARHLLLGLKNDDELKKIIERVDGIAPYQACYSGGEICPVKNNAGEFINRTHNYTFIACVF